jgi:hypothetical protein
MSIDRRLSPRTARKLTAAIKAELGSETQRDLNQKSKIVPTDRDTFESSIIRYETIMPSKKLQ